MSEGGGDKKSDNYKNRVSPNGEKRSDTKIHTDKEIAKMAGVGTGTVTFIVGRSYCTFGSDPMVCL